MPRLRADHVEGDSARPLIAVESFESFFRREFPGLVTLAYALSGSREAAEDIAQDAMMATYKRWDEIVQFEHATAYVRRTCANMAVSSMRRRWAESRAFVRLGSRREPLSQLAEDDDRFWKEVRRLPTRQAQVVALHYGCDCSVADVAAVMGTTEGSVKTQLHRARITLAERFGDEVEAEVPEEVPR